MNQVQVIIYFVLIGLAFVASLAFFVVTTRKYVKDPLELTMSKKCRLSFWSSLSVLSALFALLNLGIFFANPSWSGKTSYTEGVFAGDIINYPLQLTAVLAGSFIFAFGFALLWASFAMKYWKLKVDPAEKKLFNVLFYSSIAVSLCAFLIYSNGLGPYLTYPLANGIGIIDGQFKITTTADLGKGGFHLAFYAICIIFGVLVSYWVCDHKFYQKFHKHGILDTLVLLVFPAGVIGARIWYVVGNYQREFAGQPFSKVFEIWNGGLTILGGAFAGALVGYLFMKYRRKYVPIRFALDVCVPSILLAQAIGRWGNFFNCEVYGTVQNVSSWSFLPNWLLSQMNVNNGGGYLGTGLIHAPLFLVEGFCSLAGYFLIVYGVGKGLKKFTVEGDLAGCYFVWYGAVRLIMEPLRDSNFNMGTDNAWSIINSIVYIVIGLGVIAFLHLHDHYVKTKKSFSYPLTASVILLVSLFFPFLKGLTAASNANKVIAAYGGFAVIFSSPVLIVAYVLLILALASALVSLVFVFLKKGKYLLYFLLGSSGLALVGGALMFFANSLAGYPSTLTLDGISYTGVTYNTSYGLALLGLGAIASSLLGASFLAAKKDRAAEELRHEELDQNV